VPGYDDLVVIQPGQAVMVAGVVISFGVRDRRLVEGARLVSEPAARRAGLEAGDGEIGLVIATQGRAARPLPVPRYHNQAPPSGDRLRTPGTRHEPPEAGT
jgi:hypothetical protein